MVDKFKQKKCKQCKRHFTPTYSTLQAVCSTKCAIDLANYQIEKKASENVKEKLMKVKAKLDEVKHRKDLQVEINKLSRLIDSYFKHTTCICCHRLMNKQIHASHFHDVGGNNSLRYNLHNVHSSTSYCNVYNTSHKIGYKQGLINRYGQDYHDYVVDVIPVDYKLIKINNVEIKDTLKLVRKIIREFYTHTPHLTDGAQARGYFNNLVGIYK